MKLKSIKDIKNLKGKRILLRADFDVPIKNGRIQDDSRIQLALPTIQYLLKKQAVVIIVSHLGRPGGKVVRSLSLAPVAKRLAKLLKKPVKKLNEVVSAGVEKAVKQAKPGEVIMLENIRFHPREEKNCQHLAKKLARSADYYVNDAFATSHRKETSLLAITKFLPSYAGLNLEREVINLSQALKNPTRPLTIIIGGVKISTKLGVVKKFLQLADDILLGGALANTVLRANGVAVGKSVIEPAMIPRLKKINLTDTKLHLPLDAVVSPKISKTAKVRTTAVGNVKSLELILDIGPDTVELFKLIISRSKTIIWNGPMGVFEYPRFADGTKRTMQAILNSKAKIVIGGGDTIAALNQFAPKPIEKFKNVYISTGGGAMLKFLEEGMLVAIRPLMK